jgi:hypothetical protein
MTIPLEIGGQYQYMELIKRIFLAKHWLVFTIIMTPSVLRKFYLLNDTVLYLLFFVCYIGWFLLIGTGLKTIERTPVMNYKLFLATGILLVVTGVSFRILSQTQFIFDGAIIVPIAMAGILGGLIILSSFIAKNLKVQERGNDIDINDYFGDILLLMFFPIGIWMIQPRLNKLADKLVA